MERVANSAGRRQTEAHGVCSCRRHVYRVAEPLSGCGPTEIEAATRIGCRLQINAVRAIAIGRSICGGHVVAHTLTAGVVVLRLHSAGHCSWCSTEGPFTARGCECQVIEVPA